MEPSIFHKINGILVISDNSINPVSVRIKRSEIRSLSCNEKVDQGEWRVVIELEDGTRHEFCFFDLDSDRMIEKAMKFFQFCSL